MKIIAGISPEDSKANRDRSKVSVKVKNVSPPIGMRTYDWIAYDDAEEPQCGDPECNCPSSVQGYGETREQALSQFWEEWEERYGE